MHLLRGRATGLRVLLAGAALLATAGPSLAARDGENPAIWFKTPKEEASVSGKVRVEVGARDRSSGISRVVITIDGRSARAWTERAAPYRLKGDKGTWDTTDVDDGSHVVTAVAYDRSGRRKAVRTTITVDNTLDASGGDTHAPRPSVQPVRGAPPGSPAQAGGPGASAPAPSQGWAPGRRFFSADSPFNARIPAAPGLAPKSAAHVAGLVERRASHPFVLSIGSYSVPVYYADSRTPRHSVRHTTGWWGYDRVNGVPIPAGAEGDDGSDGHIAIVDTDSGCVYEGWQFRREPSGGYAASSFGIVPGGVNGRGVFPGGGAMNAAGFSLLAGLVTPAELERGHIDHALVYHIDRAYVAKGGPVAPATFSTGGGTTDKAAPMGALVQLDPSFDVSALPNRHERTIARALQEHGMYLRDLGGSIGLYAQDKQSLPPGTYERLGIHDDYLTLSRIPMNRMRVIAYGPQDPGRDGIGSRADPPGGCGDYS